MQYPASFLRSRILGGVLLALATALPVAADTDTTVREIDLEVGELRFDALAAGPEDGPLVLMLHGFPQTAYSYIDLLERLGEKGYLAVAPNQRGYSDGARPEQVAEYAMPKLVGDVAGMAAALKRDRFHLVGHDWGGAVAWAYAAAFPDRLDSLTVLSTPHYAALRSGLAKPEGEQAERSSYFADFAKPDAAETLLADDAAILRGILAGIEPAYLRAYLEVLGEESALRAALHWYGASQLPPSAGASLVAPPRSNRIRVPTLYLWGNRDRAFARETAEATASYVDGTYRFEELDGAGHWLTESHPEQVAAEVLRHIEALDPGATEFVGVEFSSSDVRRDASFYRSAFGLTDERIDCRADGPRWATLQGDSLWLVLNESDPRDPDAPSDRTQVTLNFQVADIEAIAERVIAAGGTRDSAPRRVAIGRSLSVYDPSGNLLNLMEVSVRPLPAGRDVALFNVGLRVPEVERLEPVLASLRFSVYTRKYLPETLVYSRNPNVSIVLHPGAQAARPASALIVKAERPGSTSAIRSTPGAVVRIGSYLGGPPSGVTTLDLADGARLRILDSGEPPSGGCAPAG